MNVSRYCLNKIEKISLRPQNFQIFKIFFPSKNHSAFLTIARYDTEPTNIKISDKNIVPPGGAQAPERGSFLPFL